MRCGMGTGTISSLNFPSAIALLARAWLRNATSSCSSRVILYFSARSSVAVPISMPLKGSVSTSQTVSAICPCCSRCPHRAVLSM